MWFLSEKFTPVLIQKWGLVLQNSKPPVFGKEEFFHQINLARRQ